MDDETLVDDPETEVEEVDEDDLPDFTDEEWESLDSDVPWHAVLAPLGVVSGDGRKIAEVDFREFPLPLRYMDADFGGHDGAVPASAISEAWVADGLVYGKGVFSGDSEVVGKALTQIANGEQRGVSVDLDAMEVSAENPDGSAFDPEQWAEGDPEPVMVARGRIAAATMCAIPAFQEAYIALGEFEEEKANEDCEDCEEFAAIEAVLEDLITLAVSEGAWDGQASRFTDAQWVRSCVLDRGEQFTTAKTRYALPVKEPNGDLSRAGVHAAAGRLGQVVASDEAKAAARRLLIAAYRALDEDPPDSLQAALAAQVFAPGTHDGPGWVTNPKETQRLRTYWTRGKGAAKIRWGVGGDFNRCRRQLAKYIPNPAFLAGTCANLHKVALGYWPGNHAARLASGQPGEFTQPGFTLLAAAAPEPLPSAWFLDPQLTGPTPLTVTDDGRIFGHLATWGTCHINPQYGECTQPPASPSNYAYFRTGTVATDAGSMPVGQITMSTGHANGRASARSAMAHYDDTGAAVADVAAGEDIFGIWVAGAVRSTASAEQVHALRAAALSGDWRKIGGSYELVAALVVNVPGFPIPRASLVASGQGQAALFAAGIVKRAPQSTLDEMVRLVVQRTLAEKDRRASLAAVRQKVRADALSAVRTVVMEG